VLAVLIERVTSRVGDAEFVERHAHLAVLGEITRLPTRASAGSNRRQHARDAQLFEESMDAMRTNLLLRAQSAAQRVMCVTSAVTQEGKTSVAVQLAVSIARAT